MSYHTLQDKAKQFPNVSEKPMFGYSCLSANNKFFTGFSKKNKHTVIVRLPKKEQESAVKIKGIRPFSHGAKAGWIEISMNMLATHLH